MLDLKVKAVQIPKSKMREPEGRQTDFQTQEPDRGTRLGLATKGPGQVLVGKPKEKASVK